MTMADWISLEEAVAIVTAQTGLEDPHSALRSAMQRGAFTCDYDHVALDIEDIDRSELLRWIETLIGPTAKSATAGNMPLRNEVERAVAQAFPDGVPPSEKVPNKVLCQQVRRHLPEGWTGSNHTIERAAGRRK
ncbi:hypothetical protein [Bradyrhizobium sp. RT3a]|uniref:hypothetical protein n=1 Tax=Bradyrhizobium sp. RT3a TaxID=3156333 RepID=UPI003396CCEB